MSKGISKVARVEALPSMKVIRIDGGPNNLAVLKSVASNGADISKVSYISVKPRRGEAYILATTESPAHVKVLQEALADQLLDAQQLVRTCPFQVKFDWRQNTMRAFATNKTGCARNFIRVEVLWRISVITGRFSIKVEKFEQGERVSLGANDKTQVAFYRSLGELKQSHDEEVVKLAQQAFAKIANYLSGRVAVIHSSVANGKDSKKRKFKGWYAVTMFMNGKHLHILEVFKAGEERGSKKIISSGAPTISCRKLITTDRGDISLNDDGVMFADPKPLRFATREALLEYFSNSEQLDKIKSAVEHSYEALKGVLTNVRTS